MTFNKSLNKNLIKYISKSLEKSKRLFGNVFVSLICVLLLFAFAGCGKSELEVKTIGESLDQDSDQNSEQVTGIETSDKSEEDKSEESESLGTASDSKEKGSEVGESKDKDSGDKTTICVYVCGAVAQEGVYELPDGSRLADALESAGGYAENAVHGYLNLAEPLVDGERIYFPYLDEEESLDMASGADSGFDSNTDSKFESKSDLQPEIEAKSGDHSESGSGLVNINTAGADELKTLSGIGDSRAADIIAYREANGSFGSIEDIMNVSGIGESIFNKIKPYITVE